MDVFDFLNIYLLRDDERERGNAKNPITIDDLARLEKESPSDGFAIVFVVYEVTYRIHYRTGYACNG